MCLGLVLPSQQSTRRIHTEILREQGSHENRPDRECGAVKCRIRTGGGGPRRDDGEMAEWSMAVVLKTTEPGRVPGVRIPLSPPF